jgi:hypothetical protein
VKHTTEWNFNERGMENKINGSVDSVDYAMNFVPISRGSWMRRGL